MYSVLRIRCVPFVLSSMCNMLSMQRMHKMYVCKMSNMFGTHLAVRMYGTISINSTVQCAPYSMHNPLDWQLGQASLGKWAATSNPEMQGQYYRRQIRLETKQNGKYLKEGARISARFDIMLLMLHHEYTRCCSDASSELMVYHE